MKKIAVITCYFDPEYVRARVIRAAVAAAPDTELVVVKNKRLGVLRYVEMLGLLLKLRFHTKPDVYVLTFRGQEILPLVLLLAGKKPVVFDEFIVPIAYAKGEKHRKSFAIVVKHALARISEPLYKGWLKRSAVILADTQAHAELSAIVSGVPLEKYMAVPVSTDESVFYPRPDIKKSADFTVFYYGNMLPLHGISYVLEAAKLLAGNKHISFLLVGGKQAVADEVAAAQSAGACIEYLPWIPFAELPDAIAKAGVCLAGPFGGTPQAQHVITGKAYQFLASGAPTIIGANVAAADFTDKKDVLISAQANPEALAETIIWAYTHQAKLTQIGKAGRTLYEKRFSNEVIARQFAQILRGL